MTEAAAPASSAVATPAPKSAGSAFAAKLQTRLESPAQEESFDVDALARRLSLSRSQLHRRVREELGQTPSELIIQFRLARAAALLTSQQGNMAEVAYAVGFRNVSHFVKRFRAQHGQTPAAYAAAAQPKRDAPAPD